MKQFVMFNNQELPVITVNGLYKVKQCLSLAQAIRIADMQKNVSLRNTLNGLFELEVAKLSKKEGLVFRDFKIFYGTDADINTYWDLVCAK